MHASYYTCVHHDDIVVYAYIHLITIFSAWISLILKVIIVKKMTVGVKPGVTLKVYIIYKFYYRWDLEENIGDIWPF